MTVTKEWLRQQIAAMEAARDDIPFGLNEDGTKTLEALKMLLAGMDSEPVIIVGNDGGDALAYRRLIQSFAPGTKLYTAPPAPVAVPDEREAFEAFMEEKFKDSIDRQRVLNGDQGYFAWDMTVAWIVWQGRAAIPGSLVSELLAIAKKAAEEADEYGHNEFNDDSDSHTKAIADWERRAGAKDAE